MKTHVAQFLVDRISAIVKLSALAILTIFMSGCCTPALWKERVYKPAADTKVQLARSGPSGDVLVQYDECQTGFKKSHPRAYWLFAYQSSLTDTNPLPKPAFVDPQTVTNLSTIPIFLEHPGQKAVASDDCYAVYAQNIYGFELWNGQTKTGEYRLPFYSLRWSTPGRRTALTPLAVAGDAALVGSLLLALSFGAVILAF